jgi:hypothetical protein
MEITPPGKARLHSSPDAESEKNVFNDAVSCANQNIYRNHYFKEGKPY